MSLDAARNRFAEAKEYARIAARRKVPHPGKWWYLERALWHLRRAIYQRSHP